jgi:DNA-binding response OmpR family regulator
MDERLKSKVIIIMLTTSLNPEDRIRAMETKEVKDFMIKPLTTEWISELADKHF